MPKYKVSYKKEYEGVIEKFSVIKEAKKPSGARMEVERGCEGEAYHMLEIEALKHDGTIACGSYGKDVGIWEAKPNHSPYSNIPRKGKWILRFFDFTVEEIE